MTNSAKLISALLVVAATTGAAHASGVSAPSQGSRDFDVSRAAPLNLPEAKAMPMPHVDAGAVSRGPLDAAAAISSYATVTLNRDGSTSETEASNTLRAIIEQMLASAGK